MNIINFSIYNIKSNKLILSIFYQTKCSSLNYQNKKNKIIKADKNKKNLRNKVT